MTYEQSLPPQPQNVFTTFSFGKATEDGLLDNSNSDLPFQTATFILNYRTLMNMSELRAMTC